MYKRQLLAIHVNDLLPREIALNKIWRDDNYFTSRSMDVYIAKLRKYLKEDSDVEILNIHGEGFRLVVSKKKKLIIYYVDENFPLLFLNVYCLNECISL